MAETSFAGPRKPLSAGAPFLLKPARPDVRLPVPAGVRLDVQDGSSVDEVQAGDLEDTPVEPEKPENAQAEGIGAMRRAAGKDAARLLLTRRGDLELGGPGFVELEDDDDVGETLETVETGREFGEDLDLTGGSLEEPWRREGRRRKLRRFFVPRADDADGPEADPGTYPTYVSHFSYRGSRPVTASPKALIIRRAIGPGLPVPMVCAVLGMVGSEPSVTETMGMTSTAVPQ